jgi:hypothetical protein
VEEIVTRYQVTLASLQEEMETELAPIQHEVNSLRQAVQTEVEACRIALPTLPQPEIAADETPWLFDSSRSYFEQLEAYKTRKNVA